MLPRYLLTISFLFYLSSFLVEANEQIDNQTTTYEIIGFKESLSESVDVSGGVLVSYQFEGDSKNPQTDSLYIATPQLESNVKIKILSIDGQYSAKFTLSLSDKKSKWTKISIPSKHQKKLSSYNAKDIAVYAFHEVPSKRRKKLWNVVPTAWGAPNSDIQYFNINTSGDTPMYVFKNAEGNKVIVQCLPVKNKVVTAFNYQCPVEQSYKFNGTPVTFISEVDGKKDKYKIW